MLHTVMRPHVPLLLAASLALLAGSPALAQPLVVVDPGHGARDPGAVGCGLEEDNVVLDVGRRTGELLEAAGLRVALTRDREVFVELRARAAFANDRGARAFVSVHANANAGNPASGTETWIANGAGANTVRLAEGLQRELVATWGLRDRGVKRNNFTVLTATNMPAALTELGFINHCQTDAVLLGSAAERQRIAAAQARAVADYLGADPPPPGPQRGTLIGVAFEDVGVGLEDTSRRLSGVRVEVQGTDASARSAADTGAWRFELEPGDYTVRATRDGFEPATRRCDPVVANGETWCSIGLRRADDPPPPPEPDAAPPPPPIDDPDGPPPPPASDGSVPDFADPDAAEPTPREDAAGLRDAARDRGLFGDGPTITQRNSQNDGGCQQSPSAPTPWWLALLLLPLALRRRRTAARLALVVAPVAGLLLLPPAPSRAHVPEVAPGGERAVDAAVQLHLHGERVLARGDFAAPVLSPDGRLVAVSSRDQRSLYIVRVADGAMQRIAHGPRVGLNPVWQADGLAFRGPAQSSSAVPLFARAPDGRDVLPRPPGHATRAWAEDDTVRLFEGGAALTVSPPGDRFFHVRVSPDGAFVVFWGLRTGLHLVRVSDLRRFEIGSGGQPRFGPAGRWLAFERTLDEGAALTGGDVFLLDLRDPGGDPVALTQTADRIELAPSVAAGRVVFLAGDALLVADVPATSAP